MEIIGPIGPWRVLTTRKEFQGRIGTRPRRILDQGHLARHLDRNSEGNLGREKVNLQQGRKTQARVRRVTRRSHCWLMNCHTQDMRGRRSGVVHMCCLAPYSATNRLRNPIVRLPVVCRRGPGRLTRRSRTHSEPVMGCRRREKRAHSRTQTSVRLR